MLIEESPDSLSQFLERRSLSLEQDDPLALIDAFIDWFESERAQDAIPVDEDGDILLFEWGTYDWGDGPTFQYNLTRQLITSAADVDDQQIWQLQLTAHYAPTVDLTDLGSADRWCGCPSGCDDSREHIRSSSATERVVGEKPVRVEVTFDRV